MVDVDAEVRSFLMAQSALTALTGDRIYGGAVYPAIGYKPSDGACICFKLRGGLPQLEQHDLLSASLQFKCYGATELKANECCRKLVDVLDQQYSSLMRWAELDNIAGLMQDLDKDREWWFTLVFFTCLMDNS